MKAKMIHHLLLRIWDHSRPLPAFITAAIYLAFSFFLPKLQHWFPEGSKNEYKLRVTLYVSLVIATGYVTLPSDPVIKVGDFPIPRALYWVVACGITFAVVKIFTTLLSLSLYQGILPDALKLNSERREQGLKNELALNAVCSNAITGAFFEEAREYLRATRLYIRDDYQFSIEVSNAFSAQLTRALSESNIRSDCATFMIRDVENGSNDFRLCPRPARNIAKEAVRQWKRQISHDEPVIVDSVAKFEQKTVVAIIPPGSLPYIVVFWSDEVLPTYPIVNALLAFDSLMTSDEIWNFHRVHSEYISKFGDPDAVNSHLESIFQNAE
ncbi:hypothetical protein [Alicyclobacillus acidoterrestris]|uniref:Uncharacterized protein n=1 Tax=Alicyclobacillus acidoterrestris (strain ATCC 49025 / DSM 3922 / CIP 106132 / NCIMB 13137 / GD3B) TaxID=1356854 RepID=A0A9E6ZXM7_ALIAG|nr:hypothetical protein [Alicyclobacillus acidoterrestris]UNO51049.1 hypothetical protein K1I37_20960 [Alicyclobacillus acidoterrestris]